MFINSVQLNFSWRLITENILGSKMCGKEPLEGKKRKEAIEFRTDQNFN